MLIYYPSREARERGRKGSEGVGEHAGKGLDNEPICLIENLGAVKQSTLRQQNKPLKETAKKVLSSIDTRHNG